MCSSIHLDKDACGRSQRRQINITHKCHVRFAWQCLDAESVDANIAEATNAKVEYAKADFAEAKFAKAGIANSHIRANLLLRVLLG